MKALEAHVDEAAASALREHVKASFERVAGWRVAVLAVFLLLASGMAFSGARDWLVYLTPLTAGLLSAVVVWALRRHQAFLRWGPHTYVLDVAMVYALQSLTMPLSASASGVAGFSLALFSLLVAMSAGAMQRAPTVVTTVMAIVAECKLMHEADVSKGAWVAAAVVLIGLAVGQGVLVSQLKRLIVSVTHNELNYRVERDRALGLENARGTIERMLADTQTQNARLNALQRDKDLLTALIVHDLRAPLAAVRANLDFLKQELASHADHELPSACEDSLEVVARVGRMVGDLLNIMRLEDGSLPVKAEPFDLVAMVGRVKRQIQAQARHRKIEVLVQLPDSIEVVGDEPLLERTLENLASNALRYTPTAGRISLEVEPRGATVELSIKNDGTPIPENARATLFDKFVQGEGEQHRRTGWGLGLYFCKLCVGAQHGSIGIEDRPGWAVTFVVRLPGAEAARVAA